MGGLALARLAIELDPLHAGALEHVATALVARQRKYEQGLALMERAVAAHPHDAGLWYALGWCCEFAAHEIARRGGRSPALVPRALYERAAGAFRNCLDLHPAGKLADDAADLLEHVENELSAQPQRNALE